LLSRFRPKLVLSGSFSEGKNKLEKDRAAEWPRALMICERMQTTPIHHEKYNPPGAG
jgi:hypothetical protein